MSLFSPIDGDEERYDEHDEKVELEEEGRWKRSGGEEWHKYDDDDDNNNKDDEEGLGG